MAFAMNETATVRAATEGDEPWLAPRAWPWLLAMVGLGAIAVRIVWILRYGHVIENQGVAYARVAENLLAGDGYIGILGGRYTLQGPLFPLLIALLKPLAGSVELAARLISCAAGVALIWPAYSFTKALGGPRAGLVAACLVAGHGAMLGFSGAAYGESLYFFLLFTAAACSIRAAKRGELLTAIAAGALYGLAYLVRPEALAYATLAAVLILFYSVAGQSRGRVLTGTLSLLLAFVVVVSPYVSWLSANTGSFRLEGKSLYNAMVNDGMSRGMSFGEAAFRITPDLKPVGPDMFTNQFEIPPTDHSGLLLVAKTIFQDPVMRVLPVARRWIGDSGTGGMLLATLAGIGLISAFVGRGDRRVAGFALLMTAGYVGVILSVRFFSWSRYIYPFTFFALPWAAAGVSALVAGAGKLCSMWSGSIRLQMLAKLCLTFALTAAVCVNSLSARYSLVFRESHMPQAVQLKTAGLWIREQGQVLPIVMGFSAVVPFYARGTLAYLPWATEESHALRYVHARNPHFIVLRTGDSQFAPYIEQWLGHGIPDPCAREVQRLSDAESDEQLITYRWTCHSNRPESFSD
jgi:4-amino-4-deoxy-L-arabinose transferase-like glycosyltransferase